MMSVARALTVYWPPIPALQKVHLSADTEFRKEPSTQQMNYGSKSLPAELNLAALSPTLDGGFKGPNGLRSTPLKFCNGGKLENASDALHQLDQKGVLPSVHTYFELLQMCETAKDLAGAQRVHAHLAKNGLENNLFLAESLVNTLVKCGSLEKALQIFHKLRERTVFSWTAIMIGYTQGGQAKEALALFEQMQTSGVQPNKYTLVTLLRACASLSDLETGKRLHSEVWRCGCEHDVFVGNTLTDMYARCGSMADAQIVFGKMALRNLVSWSIIVAAYAQQGQGRKALDLYMQMQLQGFEPDERIFASVLKACNDLAAVETSTLIQGVAIKVAALLLGKVMQAEAARRGYDGDAFFGSTLVHFYATCGSTADSHQVFEKLNQRDVVIWTALIAGHAQYKQCQQALRLFYQMHEEGISPNHRTLVALLKSCSNLAEAEDDTVVDNQLIRLETLQKVKAIHAEAICMGCDADVFLGTSLVSLYAKCGSIRDAQLVFDKLPERNVVSWNAMIAGYAQQAQGHEAWDLYMEMQAKSVTPDMWTFAAVLKALGCIAATAHVTGQPVQSEWLQKGKQVHVETVKRGFESDVYVSNTLVHMYASFGNMLDARLVFDNLHQCNVVSWNAMIAGYAQQEQGHKALQIYRKMQEEGVEADSRTFVSVLKACEGPTALETNTVVDGTAVKPESFQLGKALHAEIARKVYASDLYIANTLLRMYANCGSMADAKAVFDNLPQCDVVSWNSLLAGYVQQEQGEKAWQLYVEMQEAGVKPDAGTFVSVLKACSIVGAVQEDVLCDGQPINLQALEKGKAVHFALACLDYDSDLFVCNALIAMYASSGSMPDAQYVFDNMQNRNVVSWNTLMTGYAQSEHAEKALDLYAEMSAEGICPNDATFLGAVKACSKIGALNICKQIHGDITEVYSKLNVSLATALIHAYSRCGSMSYARQLFDSLTQQDVVAWSALISGYAWQGDYTASLQCFEEMQQAGVTPNGITCLSVLSVCSHAGLVDEGLKYFQSMTSSHAISRSVEHYAVMVDLLGRAGLVSKAEALILEMPMQPDWVVWASLLSACRKAGDVLLGRRTFDRLVRLVPKESAAYIMMYGIYADAGMWGAAQEIYDLKLQAGATKSPARTWIDHEQEQQRFMVADQTNPYTEQIYAGLDELTALVKAEEMLSVNGA